MINEETDMDDTPEVQEFAAPVSLATILTLLAITIGFVWGMDWRIFWTACVVGFGVVVVTLALDHRRREQAEFDAEDAMNAAFQEAMKRNPVGQILQPTEGARVEIHRDAPIVRGFNAAGMQVVPMGDDFDG